MTEVPPAVGPLTDLKVVETGQLLAGPFCGQLLADQGAEVIKVEAPGRGDPLREWGQTMEDGLSLWWSVVARNKKCITLDLREVEGQALLRELLKDADVLIENFRPGTMEGWNLDYASLSALNPRLIMVRVSGQGQTGPYARRAGYGSIGEAMGGLRYVTGDPSTPPSRTGISIGDSLAATHATIGCLAALHERERTGRGQVVDSAIYEAVLGMMESLVADYDQTGYVRERTGATLPKIAPSNVYPTKDGQMILVAANQDTVFARLAAAMGQPELADDPRYATHHARGERQAELDARITAWTETQEADALVERLSESGVPVGKTYRAPDMLRDPHFEAREAIVRVPHPTLGSLAMQNVVPKLSRTPGAVRWAGPALGRHNREIYVERLGLSEAELAALRARGIV
jgi:formyl-CoA transferase